jgi:AraC family L-rhamnose operon transcriptional activator RhaR/AraC family L-rhamnose operon regulatory protein RhaS
MRESIVKVASEIERGKPLHLSVHTLGAGAVTHPHWHDFLELELVTEGEGDHLLSGRRTPLRRGSVYLIAYHDFHKIRATAPMTLINLQYTEELLPLPLREAVLSGGGALLAHLSEEDTVECERLLSALGREAEESDAYTTIGLEAQLTSLMLLLLRRGERGKDPPLPHLVSQTVAYLRAHFREEISLGDTARHLAVTPNYLGKCFARVLGVSFTEYLNGLRLHYARGLLLGSRLSLGEIAEAAGYRSPEYFSFAFRRSEGVSPSAFRREARE